jgi:release factor glutamine methyltransferase
MSFADTLADLSGAKNVAAARRLLTARFEQASLDSPSLDARLLIQHALGLEHAALASAPDRTLTAGERNAIAQLAERRLGGEPVARIFGVKEFWGLALSLSCTTLVPRPETETIVEAALAAVEHRRSDPLRIADLGTGTGALLLALLHELPNATGVGTDIAAGAIETAQANAKALGFSARAKFLQTNFGSGLAPRFDLVVSNPPYIATDEIAALAPEVRDHDPQLALDGGRDGLDAYRILAAQMPALLHERGAAVMEIGIGQATQVEEIFKQAGLRLTFARADLAGIVRALTFRRGDNTHP